MKAILANRYLRVRNFLAEHLDPVLLVFLLVLTNYRISFKLIAIAGIFLYRPNFRFRWNGITWFYAMLLLLGLINLFFISGDLSGPHVAWVSVGCTVWLFCFLVHHQLHLFIEKNTAARIEGTLKVLVLINFVVSLLDLWQIMLATGTINPYTQVNPPPYGVSSGDMVGGVFGELHLVNTVVCCLMIIFFVHRKEPVYVLLSAIPFLLTGSNLATLILYLFLFTYLLFLPGLIRKYIALSCLVLVYLFYVKVTPDNQDYMIKTLKAVVGSMKKKSGTGAKTTTRPVKTKEELVYEYIDHRKKQAGLENDTLSSSQRTFLMIKRQRQRSLQQQWKMTDRFFYFRDSVQKTKMRDPFFEYGYLKQFPISEKPGKLISFQQTYDFLRSDPKIMAFGGGIGSFSSRHAFVASGIVNDGRLLGSLPHYETRQFSDNHKALFKFLMFQPDETHSITNLPFCWYNELFAEYGLLGALIFVIFYLGYFFKRFRQFSYGKLLLVAIVFFFVFDYWYQRLSVMVLFELLMLLDLKFKKEPNAG